VTPSSSSNVIFEPYPKQLEFIEAVFSGKYSFLCYGGAMGGGKSYVCLAIAILLAKVYPGSIWCVIRESLPTLKKTSLATFMKVCPKQFIAGYNQQDQTVTFTNGSKMLFMAEDYANDKDFDRFKGLEVSGFILEQIEELNEGLLDVCFIRAGRHKLPKQPPPLVIANVNPTLMWPKAKIYDAYNSGTLPPDWFYLPAKITDNPALSTDNAYMDRLKNLDALTYRRLIDGDWTAFAVKSPFLYSFSIAKHEIESYAPNPNLPIIISFDFNKDPMTCLVGQSLDLRHLCIFDELKIANGSTPELCEMIVAKYPRWLGQIYVTGDASGHSRSPLVRGGVNHYIIIKKALGIKDGQFWVRKQNLSHINSRVLCNSVLQNANFTITKNCKETVADCVYASVDEEGELIKTVKEGRHFFDNVRYMIDAKFPDFITKPQKYQ
jgi:hypothetical protein